MGNGIGSARDFVKIVVFLPEKEGQKVSLREYLLTIFLYVYEMYTIILLKTMQLGERITRTRGRITLTSARQFSYRFV